LVVLMLGDPSAAVFRVPVPEPRNLRR